MNRRVPADKERAPTNTECGPVRPRLTDAVGAGRSTILDLQRSVGNRAVTRLLNDPDEPAALQPVSPRRSERRAARMVLQRRFEPALVTTNAHLRKSKPETDEDDLEVKTGYFGRIGNKLEPNHELMVDDADKSGNWIRAVDVDAAGWKPSLKTAPDKTFIRQTSVAKVAYPKGSVRFDESLGEFEKLLDSQSTPNAWLVKRQSDQKVVKFDSAAGIVLATDQALFSYQDIDDLGGWTKFGPSPDDNLEILKFSNGQTRGYFKAPANVHLPADPADLTSAEKMHTVEVTSKRSFEARVALDPRLKRKAGARTVNISYTPAKAKGKKATPAITVKVLGNPGDALYADQLVAVRAALTTLEGSRVPLKNGLQIVLSSLADPGMKQEAFHFGAGAVVLTPNLFHDPNIAHTEEAVNVKGGAPQGNSTLGVAHQLARGLAGDARKGQIGEGVVIHEIGHVMHKIMNPEEFLEATSGDVDDEPDRVEMAKKSQAASKVSHYAWNAGAPPAEIVAEVFTGLTSGQKYPRDVIEVYKKYGGPKVWAKEEDVIARTRPENFTTTSLDGDVPNAGSIKHLFTWESSTGSKVDLKGIITREKVAFRTDPGKFMPIYKIFVRAEGDRSQMMSELKGNILYKTGAPAESCGGNDIHSPGQGPWFDKVTGFTKKAGSLVADQVYQYKDLDGTWKDIPHSSFTITRTLGEEDDGWYIETTKTGQGEAATARVRMYDRMEDCPPELLGAH